MTKRFASVLIVAVFIAVGCMSAHSLTVPGVGIVTTVRSGDFMGPNTASTFWQQELEPADGDLPAKYALAMHIVPPVTPGPLNTAIAGGFKVWAAHERRPNRTDVRGVSKAKSKSGSKSKSKSSTEQSQDQDQYQDQDQDQYQEQDQDQQQGQEQDQKQDQDQQQEQNDEGEDDNSNDDY